MMPQSLAAPEAGFTAYIKRLSVLIGSGFPVPETIPPDEIEQAKLHLVRIGIVIPAEVRPILPPAFSRESDQYISAAKVKRTPRNVLKRFQCSQK